MIYLELFWGFLTVGLFSFGGAYGAIPLIRDVVISYGWLSEEKMMDMIAVSESTPGPIMVNLATYVGSSRAGILGGIIATFAVVLPAFLIILLIMGLLKRYLENRYVQVILRGLKPCIIGIILATGCYMILICSIYPVFNADRDFKPLILLAVLGILYYGSGKLLKKKMSPIMLIMISAGLGVAIYGV